MRPQLPCRPVKSSHSTTGECVQWEFRGTEVHVSDSKCGDGVVLEVSVPDWEAFTRSVTAGEGPDPAGALAWHTDGLDFWVHLRTAPEVSLRFSSAEWAAFLAGVRDGETAPPQPAPAVA